MGIIIRQSFKSTLVFYAAAFFGAINRLFLLPKCLSPTEIGLVDNLTYLGIILATFSSLGSTGLVARFHQQYKNKALYSQFIGFVFFLSILGFLFFTSLFFLLKPIITELFSENRALFSFYYYTIPLLALIFIIRSIFLSYSTSEKRLTVPTILSDFWIKGASFVLLLLLFFNFIYFNSYVPLLLVFYLISTLILIVYTVKVLNFKIVFKNRKSLEIKELVKYSLFVLLAGFSGQITQYADSIMLGSLKGFDTSGIYSIAFFIGISIEMPRRAITSISFPIIASYFENNELKKINKLYKQTSINQGLIGFLFYLLVFVNLDFIFQVIPNGDVYEAGKYVVLLIGASKILDMFMGVNAEIIRTSKYYYVDLYFLIFLVIITVLSNYLLIPKYNINGAATATLISVLSYNLIRFFYLKKKLNLSPFTRQSFWLLLIFGAFLLICVFLSFFQSPKLFEAILITGVKSILIGGGFIFVCYKTKVSEEFNSVLKIIIKRVMV